MHITFTSSCSTHWCAIWPSCTIDARMPGILLAAIDAPTPVPHTRMARSALPAITSAQTLRATSGKSTGVWSKQPWSVTSWPRLRHTAMTPALSGNPAWSPPIASFMVANSPLSTPGAGWPMLAPIRARIGADHAAAGAYHARAERRHRDRFRVVVDVENHRARAGAAIDQERAHAVRPHVAERHRRDRIIAGHARFDPRRTSASSRGKSAEAHDVVNRGRAGLGGIARCDKECRRKVAFDSDQHAGGSRDERNGSRRDQACL